MRRMFRTTPDTPDTTKSARLNDITGFSIFGRTVQPIQIFSGKGSYLQTFATIAKSAQACALPYCVVLRPLDQIDFAWS